ncbi:MAG: polyprenyl synthetase family protein [Candidatus Eisenbacteria bacterium]
MDIATALEQERLHVEGELERHLPAEGEYPERIHEAIRYSVLDGGKRLRPIIALAATRALGHDRAKVVKAACSVEYVHCCSLVLDDLPSMDDAKTRRGRPTTHGAFGVATGILAADALLMHAFKLVADNGVDVGASGPMLARAVRDLATAVGSYGMVGGQHVDLEVAGRPAVDMETLEYIQSRKTGALFVVAATLGGTLLGAAPEGLAALKQYAGKLGLAYQIVDDILDAVGDAEAIGKDVRKDVDKASFVTIQGVDAARRSAASLISQARDALTDLDGDTAVLDDIAAYCLDRSH